MTSLAQRPPSRPRRGFHFRFRSEALAALATALMFLASLAGVWDAQELRAVDAAFRLRGPQPPASPVVIAAIDDYSFANNTLPWPWPRTYLAQLIDRIASGGAKALALDVFLFDPEDLGKGATYIVQGETLADIAAQYGVTLSALGEANQLDLHAVRLCAGQRLIIPAAAPTEHVVALDSLADLAARYGVSVTTLMAANHLTDACELTARQLLRIPVLASVPYVVKAGDTVENVAALFQINALAIAQPDGQPARNPLTPGQTLTVQFGDAALAASIKAAGNVVLNGEIGAAGNDTEKLFLPLPDLKASQAGFGIANIGPDADGVVHRILAWQRAAVDGQVYYSWPLVTAALYANQPLEADPSREALVWQSGLAPLDGGWLRINFRGPPGTIPSASALSIINGDVSPEVFRGKIVFIGATTESLHDMHPTPFSSQHLTPGVEVMANALDTVLSRQFIYPRSGAGGGRVFALAAILLAGLAAWPLLKIRRPGLAVAALAGLLAAYAIAWLAAFVWLRTEIPLVAPELTLFLAFMAPTVERAIREEREKRRVRGIFELFISPEMVKQLVAQGIEAMRGQRAELTVLFSDIRGFTTLSEKLTPEALVSLLNEYLGAMTEVIHRNGGTVDKYEGDLVMAFFGAPLPQADHALRAVQTALEMRQELDRLRAKWEAEGQPSRLEMGIGLNSGEVFVGLVGSGKRVNYTVMGDAVNLASRLQDLTKDFQWPLLISEFTYAQVKDQFEVEFGEARLVKGKTVPVGIYKVLGRKGAPQAERLRPLFT
jgi:adenylate cyclase